MLSIIRQAIEAAIKNRHRRLIVFSGSWRKCVRLAAETVAEAVEAGIGEKILYAAEFPLDSKQGDLRYEYFKSFGFKAKKIAFPKTKEILGKTYDILILDAFENFPPKEVGILVEMVRGPGLVIFLFPPLEEWKAMKTVFHENILTPPYDLQDCRSIYHERVLKKLMESDGVYIFDADKEKPIKVPKEKRKKTRKKKEIEIPEETNMPKVLYRICATQDQVEVLKRFEGLGKKCVVVVADRGRGKSAAMGLGITGFSYQFFKKHRKKARVLVVAPTYENADEVFHFLKIAHRRMKLPYDSARGHFSSKLCEVEYVRPPEAIGKRADLVIVDEAAGVYVPILRKLSSKERIFFSTTVHGYEGTGRSFQVRFLPELREKREVELIRMTEPIRYAEGDPVEKWLYDVYLLDAEPAKLTERDIKDVEEKNVQFEMLDLRKLFLEDEKTLREFIGIYVFAHYRNNPKDIALLADAPNQLAFCLKTSSGKVVLSLQVAMEGGLRDEDIKIMLKGEIIQGNIIPDLLVKYYEAKGFAKRRGLRIVRIATHPELMRRGLGSYALKLLEEWGRKNDFSWVGASFGATPELLRFWLKNGFTPIHVSPKRNPETGEYSVVVLKPLKNEIKKYLPVLNEATRHRIVYDADSAYFYMPTDVILQILATGISEEEMKLRKSDLYRLRGFLKKRLFYEAISDIAYRITLAAFLSGRVEGLTVEEMRLLIEKVLKKRPWRMVAEDLGRSEEYVWDRTHRALRKLLRRLKDAGVVRQEADSENTEGGENNNN